MLLKVPTSNPFEAKLEWWLFFSRWVMIVAYAGLILVMTGLAFIILSEALNFFIPVVRDLLTNGHVSLIDSVVTIVDILDLMLIGSLLVMVLIGGYENTISRISKSDNTGPSWVGELDLSHLKIKVAASIVLISGVHLLKIFLNLRNASQVSTAFDYNIFWSVVIHLVFVISVLLLAYVDKLSSNGSHKQS